MIIEYEWDEQNNLLNIEKHGLSFELAAEVFTETHLTRQNARFDYGEDRYLTTGSLKERIVTVAHTLRNEAIRIVSMRKANEREQKIYLQKTRALKESELSYYWH